MYKASSRTRVKPSPRVTSWLVSTTTPGERTWLQRKQSMRPLSSRCKATWRASRLRQASDRSQTEYLKSELQRSQGKLSNAALRSPIDGIVITPELQNLAGKHLDAGAPFAQVLDLETAVVNIAIDEEDEPLLRSGQPTAIKLDSFPTQVWRGHVSIVGAEADAADAGRSFAARVPLANRDGELRSGMAGRAKIFIGYRPAGVVLLRRPALWIWQTAWDWIGW